MGKIKWKNFSWESFRALPARLRVWLKNAPIKTSLIVLTALNAIVTFVVLGVLSSILMEWVYSQQSAYRIYLDENGNIITRFEYESGLNQGGQGLDYTYERIPAYLSFLSSWGNTLLIFGGSFAAIALEAAIFYNMKLKTPLQLLTCAAGRIANNDLDFTLSYGFQDEMGALCAAFEKTRRELERNNKVMWRMVEDRKRVNAAFAHDLRTPITVLKGYTDFLSNYLPQGRVTQEKLLSTINHMSGAVSRLESYVDLMSKVQKLEDIQAKLAYVPMDRFVQKLCDDFQWMAAELSKELVFENQLNRLPYFDEQLVLRVAENLISNALRYAQKTIWMTLTGNGPWLRLIVSDDGPGFACAALQRGTDPFFRDKAAKGEHFGMGLNICKTLCEKHGGSLTLQNKEQGGASVTASFLCV